MSKRTIKDNKATQELQLAVDAAERVLDAKRKIKQLTEDMNKDIELVRAHAKATGERRYGSAEVYERSKPVKLVYPEGFDENKLKEVLKKNKLYKYTKLEVDVKEMIKNWGDDEALMKLLEKYSIYAEQDIEFHIKAF